MRRRVAERFAHQRGDRILDFGRGPLGAGLEALLENGRELIGLARFGRRWRCRSADFCRHVQTLSTVCTAYFSSVLSVSGCVSSLPAEAARSFSAAINDGSRKSFLS